jgi:hypothetical protein
MGPKLLMEPLLGPVAVQKPLPGLARVREMGLVRRLLRELVLEPGLAVRPVASFGPSLPPTPPPPP